MLLGERIREEWGGRRFAYSREYTVEWSVRDIYLYGIAVDNASFVFWYLYLLFWLHKVHMVHA